MIIQGKNFSDGIILIQTDYSVSERAGAEGCFQICDIFIQDEYGNEQSIIKDIKIDQGFHYQKVEDVVKDMGLNPQKVNYQEV